jgi:hypothetical protein
MAFLSGFIASLPLTAAILPEDRADALYHSYDGDGATIDGPSVMARKQIGKSFSFLGNVYMDSVTSATIDVRTYASPYTEERTQYTVAADYLHDKTTLSLSYTSSEESDYSADTYSFGISHDMFGSLTTVSLGVSKGSDDVKRNNRDEGGNIIDSPSVGEVDRWRYRLDLSQILTKDLIVSLGYETITDEGKLNNPYRAAFYINEIGFLASTEERYPETRTSTAVALRAKYYLPWRAALHAEGRIYSDTWDIDAQMFEIGITQPLFQHWVFDLHYRAYSQTAASFFADIHPYEKKYMGRDKELSTFTTSTFGGSVSYDFMKSGWWKLDRGSATFSYKLIQLDYEDFYDQSNSVNLEDAANAPLFAFDANVIQFFVSVWY